MDKSEFDEIEQQFGSNPQQIDETPEQRVATNVSQQLLSNAFETQIESQIESQIEPQREKDSNELQTGEQSVGQSIGQSMDAFEQQFNQNIVKPLEQIVMDSNKQLDKDLGVYDYEPEYEVEYEEEEEEEDSLNEPNKASDLMFAPKIETQTELKGNEEILYQLSDDSSVLRAKNYGIGSDLRIDSQSDQKLENIPVYELNSEDPFQTPEKRVEKVEENIDLLPNIQTIESVSTDFGISSMSENNNLLDLDINNTKNESNVMPVSVSHPLDPSQSEDDSDEDIIAYNYKNEEVVTSGGEVFSSLPTHNFAEIVSLNENVITSSDTTNSDLSSAPNLENLQTIDSQINSSSEQHFNQDIHELETKSTKVEKQLLEEKSETPFVPIIPKTMAKTEEVKESSNKSVASDACPCSPSEWFNSKHMNPTVAELVYWRNPKNSGIVFGSGLVILICLTFFSIISVVAYTSLAALSVTLSFRIYKNILQAVQKTSEGHPFKEYLEVEITPSNERIHQIVDSILSHVNCTLNKLRSVFLVEDIIDSLKFVVLFWCLTYIGSWFNGLTLIILAYLALFSVPKVYEMNKTQIDQYLNLASTQINDITSKIRAKIPFPSKKEKDN